MYALNIAYRLLYDIDWMAKDAVAGRLGKKVMTYSLLGLIMGGVISNYSIGLENNNEIWDFYRNIEAFLWLALYFCYLYYIKSTLSFLSGFYYFLAVLVFFLKYCLLILTYHLLMFFLILGIALFLDVRNDDFDVIDSFFRFVASGYFYSLLLSFLYKIKKTSAIPGSTC